MRKQFFYLFQILFGLLLAAKGVVNEWFAHVIPIPTERIAEQFMYALITIGHVNEWVNYAAIAAGILLIIPKLAKFGSILGYVYVLSALFMGMLGRIEALAALFTIITINTYLLYYHLLGDESTV